MAFHAFCLPVFSQAGYYTTDQLVSCVRGSSVKLHTATVPPRRDELANRFGVQITSPARTIVDVADIGADPSVVIEATAHALGTGLVSPSELRAAVKRRSARVRRLVERALREAGTGA